MAVPDKKLEWEENGIKMKGIHDADGRILVTSPDMPALVVSAATIEEARRSTKEILEFIVAYFQHRGVPLPKAYKSKKAF